MEENRDKKPVRKENPIREWISDNLRYIILIVAIIGIVVLVIFGVKVISNHFDNGEGKKTEQGSSQEQPKVTPEATVTPKVTEEPKATDAPKATETPVPTQSGTPAPTANPEKMTAAGEEATEVVTGYFQALADKDSDALMMFVDELSQEDRAAVENNQLIDTYSHVKVYTYPGIEPNTYVALVAYDYKYKGYNIEVPGLTQLYLHPLNGKLYIASEVTDEKVTAHINQILEKDDVKQLIADTQAKYENVLNGHEDLKAYVESLN